MCASAESGFVMSMNWLSWLRPKKSWITAERLFDVTSLIGESTPLFGSYELMRSRMRRSVRARPWRQAFSSSSPVVRMRRLPRWSMSSTEPRPVAMFSSRRSASTTSMPSSESTRRPRSTFPNSPRRWFTL